MKRGTFLKITSISSLGLFLGFDVLARANASNSILSISAPTIHGRHGLYNLHNSESDELMIQRDVLTRNGLTDFSKERITTVTINDGKHKFFGMIGDGSFLCEADNVSVYQLKKGRSYDLEIPKNSLVFSELHPVSINGNGLSNEQAFFQKNDAKLKVISTEEQYLVVYVRG